MTGPYETERDARESPAVQVVYDAFDADPGAGKMAPHNFLTLIKACETAGVNLGGPTSYDRQILAWLAKWEPTTCAVIAGLISRAHAPELDEARGAPLRPAATLNEAQLATVLAALGDALAHRKDRAGGYCAACEREYGGLCYDHASDETAADDYDALARELGGQR